MFYEGEKCIMPYRIKYESNIESIKRVLKEY